MSQIKILYRLQQLDSAIDTCRSRVREINAALEQDQALRQAQTQVAELENTLRPQETHVTDLNLEIKTVAEQTAQFSERLYSGTVSNPKELADLQNKIAERKRHRAHLEDELLETMIRVEELQVSLAEAQAVLREVETSWGHQQKTLTSELQRLKQELKTLKTDRQAAADTMTADNLAVYENLRVQKKGHAVAVLSGDSCSVCRVEQTGNIIQQVRQDQRLVMCTSCGRILVIL